MPDATPSNSRRPARRTILAAWIGGAVLLLLHLDFWRPQRAVLYFGWVPEELLYRLVWVGLAWGYLMYFCSRVWTDPE